MFEVFQSGTYTHSKFQRLTKCPVRVGQSLSSQQAYYGGEKCGETKYRTRTGAYGQKSHQPVDLWCSRAKAWVSTIQT